MTEYTQENSVMLNIYHIWETVTNPYENSSLANITTSISQENSALTNILPGKHSSVIGNILTITSQDNSVKAYLLQQDTNLTTVDELNALLNGHINGNGVGEKIAQQFTSNITGNLALVRINIVRGGTPTDDLVIRIVSTLDGNEIASKIFTPVYTDMPDITGLPNYISFDSCLIEAGGTYYIQLERIGDRDIYNSYGLPGSTTDDYPYGEVWDRKNEIWYKFNADQGDISFTFWYDNITGYGKINSAIANISTNTKDNSIIADILATLNRDNSSLAAINTAIAQNSVLANFQIANAELPTTVKNITLSSEQPGYAYFENPDYGTTMEDSLITVHGLQIYRSENGYMSITLSGTGDPNNLDECYTTWTFSSVGIQSPNDQKVFGIWYYTIYQDSVDPNNYIFGGPNVTPEDYQVFISQNWGVLPTNKADLSELKLCMWIKNLSVSPKTVLEYCEVRHIVGIGEM